MVASRSVWWVIVDRSVRLRRTRRRNGRLIRVQRARSAINRWLRSRGSRGINQSMLRTRQILRFFIEESWWLA
ncbi:hypothetical protein RISK_006399 [Rhodopirellula islandica]|uniref:Uncharacterized protein n=1 Tax=Rhodopirellula islandica TaxID=595434 RepID=A0A0J1B468_RHOIS|nr:hypothetical protein RISK_006399 [Rhodopirellula islandica]